MRRTVHFWLILLLIAVGAVFGVTLWSELSLDINQAPVISFDSETITVSVEDDESVLLEGVTATDAEDGDVTDSVVVETIDNFQEDGSRLVTYAAFDSSGNVTKATRALTYSDYTSPEIVLVQELKTVVGTEINLQDCIQVNDVLDGNITNLLRVTESDYSNYVAGEYEVTLQVTNSAGDTVEQTFTIVCLSEADGSTVSIALSVYSVTIGVGDDFDPEDYIDGVTGYDDDGDELTEDDVEITGTVDTDTAGTYTVNYSLEGNGGTGSARLTVIVEE